MKMTISELKERLQKCVDEGDPEEGHIDADKLLLEYINDEDVTKLHGECAVWFA